MRCRIVGIALAAALASGGVANAKDPPKITADEVGSYINKRVMVCGTVVQTRTVLAPEQGGKQYFLHFGQQAANAPFVVVIIGNDLAAGGVFHDIDKRANQKEVCATGYPKNAGGAVQMRVDAPNQLKIVDDSKQ